MKLPNLSILSFIRDKVDELTKAQEHVFFWIKLKNFLMI